MWDIEGLGVDAQQLGKLFQEMNHELRPVLRAYKV